MTAREERHISRENRFEPGPWLKTDGREGRKAST